MPAAPPARAPSPLMLAGSLVAALAVALAPLTAPELPDAGPARAELTFPDHRPNASPGEIRAGERAPLPIAASGSGAGAGGRRGGLLASPPRPGHRLAAAQLRLALSQPPAPTMHLSAHARVVLFPEQGPPPRGA